ncbi:MAG TPA: redoxin domain-containing protein [Terracidiphilus sp.]|nr:redoxin domain-containing protein [Terracidiphilus sp.]
MARLPGWPHLRSRTERIAPESPAQFLPYVHLPRIALLAAALMFTVVAARAATDQPKPGEPTDSKARKTFQSAQDWEHHGNLSAAVDDYRKANKQDGGHCIECLSRAYNLAMKIGAYKDAVNVERDELSVVQTDQDRAEVHFQLGVALEREGSADKKEEEFSASCEEFRAALSLDPSVDAAHFAWGTSLAFLHQDDAARDQFSAFLKLNPTDEALRERATRYVERPELARARMAPPFSITTIDGHHISMDGLAGKVVLIDFWATWCGPCREALPHVREIAQKFQGQPFVVLSVSLDSDEGKWRDFVSKNGMTWLQYRDGLWTGPVATEFGVKAIPATFSIDADGVLEDQHVGDENIEGRLKKMIAHAAEKQNNSPATAGVPAGQSRAN